MPDRQKCMTLIEEANRGGARLSRACSEIGISVRTYQRWKTGTTMGDRRPTAERPIPKNKLSAQEREKVLATINQEEYQSLAPGQIVPKLADEGLYLASEATMYRIMKEERQLNHRGRRRKPQKKAPTTHKAAEPNEVWMWDITWLRGPILGQFFYLYLVLDLFSRKIVAWEVYETECGENASELIQKAVWREQVSGKPIVLHSDNGSPMKAATFLETLRSLGLSSSYSRPRVSNDNAFVERLFGTAKYRPDFPSKGFASVEDAQNWVLGFVRWYNEEHQHSSIGFVTPQQRHQGKANTILSKRTAIYEMAREARPERWSRGIRNWGKVKPVTLNPTKEEAA